MCRRRLGLTLRLVLLPFLRIRPLGGHYFFPKPGLPQLLALGILTLEIVCMNHQGSPLVPAMVEKLHARWEQVMLKAVDSQGRMLLEVGRKSKG